LKDNRVGIIGIIIKDRRSASVEVNKILSEFADIIIARIGFPYSKRSLNVISIIIDGNTDQVGALTGRLGKIDKVVVKSMFTD
jgi:putative iron-only hydrogenase system regulator